MLLDQRGDKPQRPDYTQIYDAWAQAAEKTPLDVDLVAFAEACKAGQFLDTKPGTYVAFGDGKLLGSGEDRTELITRLFMEGHDLAMMVQQVNVPIEIRHIRSPRMGSRSLTR